ncbi:hypothetical protein [Pseudonocardia nigra]|uniref:hypothetical protein n=1 Tax=Pseudonocardia nigra TaxID=1921578 RepID=UPI001C5E1DE6|nr:hypothetical protein [Pseudonocardia nigra]
MAIWLVAGHGLWERRRTSKRLRNLLNSATVLTITMGVFVSSLALFTISLTAAALVIPPGYMSEVLGHDVDWSDYARVGLMATDKGILAGAVGSGLEDDETVRRAAYSTREQERRTQMAAG